MVKSPFLIGTRTERERASRIGIARLCVGGSLLLLTGLARRLFGVPANQDNSALRLLARLAGIRNMMLGIWALAAREQGVDHRRLCYQLNAATDATDVGILVLGGLTGEGLGRTAIMSVGLGGSALLAWVELLQDLDGEHRRNS